MTDLITHWWCQGSAWCHDQAGKVAAQGHILDRSQKEKGSVTMENVIWALAVIVIAAIVVAAITAYVNKYSNQLIGS